MIPEIPKQNPQSKQVEQLQPLSPELQIQFQKEKEQVLMLSKAQRATLSNEVIVSYLNKFHNVDISKYSKDIQQKFIEEIQMIFSEFKDFDESMITRLREIRENMSFWQETWKSNAYYRNMILWNKINTRITILQESITTIYWEKIKIWNIEYNKKDFTELKEETTKLDQKNWLNLFSKLESKPIATNYWGLSGLFYQELQNKITNPQPPWSLNYRDVMTGLSSINALWNAEKLTNVKLINGQVINLFELYKEYNKFYQIFENQNQIFQIWNKQLQTTNWFWFQQQYNWLWYDKLEKVYAEKLWDIEKMGTADLLIMMRVLFGILPLFDAVSSYDDLKQAKWWINFDGSLQETWETALWYASPVLWVLSVIWVWYGIKVALNSPKYAKIMVTIWKIVDKLSKWSWLVELGKNEKVMKMLEMMKWVIPKVEELLEKIKNWGKQGTQKVADTFPNTTRVIVKPKKQVLPKIQPGIILWNIESMQEIEKYSMDISNSLWISKNSEKYKIIFSDVNLLLKTASHSIESNLLLYKEILKLNPNFSFGKSEFKNPSNLLKSPSHILYVYGNLLRENELKDILIHQWDNKIIFRMIDDIWFEIPNNWEEFNSLLKIFENFPNQNISTRLKILDIFSSESDNITKDEKYKLATLLLLKWVDENLLQSVHHTYLYGEFNLMHDELLNLRNIIRDETKSKAEIENAIHDFYKILEEKEAKISESLQLPAWNPWDMVDLNEIRDTAQRNPLFERFPWLLSFAEKFNPKTWLEYIKKLSPIEKQKAMKIWKEKLKEQLDIMASFPTEIKKSAEKFDYIKDKPDVIVNALVNEFVLKLEDLSIEQRKQVITGIEKYVNKVFIVHKYANDTKYINNPKQLISDAFWVDLSKLKWEITMDIDWGNFTFYVHNNDDYKIVKAYWDEELAKNSPSSWWFASSWAKIPELRWTISVSNWKKEWRAYAIETKIHETKHMDNQILMPDHNNWDILSYAKDEIIAFSTDGRDINEIKTTLFKTGDRALYDYYKTIKENDPERYKKLRIFYEKELDIAIDIVQKFKTANIPNYVDILAITPVRQWGNLEKIYLNPNLSEIQKMEKNIQQIFEKVYETVRALESDTDNLIGQENLSSAIFYTTWIVWIGFIVFHYFDEKYPNWRTDFENNNKKYFENMKDLLNENKIKAYLDEYF